MPEHVHLLLSEPQRVSLADAIKSLKQGVSHYATRCEGVVAIESEWAARKRERAAGRLCAAVELPHSSTTAGLSGPPAGIKDGLHFRVRPGSKCDECVLDQFHVDPHNPLFHPYIHIMLDAIPWYVGTKIDEIGNTPVYPPRPASGWGM